MSPMTREAKALFETARGDAPSEAARARIRAGIAAKLASPGGSASGSSSGKPSTLGRAPRGIGFGALGVAAIAGVLSGRGFPLESARAETARSLAGPIAATTSIAMALEPREEPKVTMPSMPSTIAIEDLEETNAAAIERRATPSASARSSRAPESTLGIELRMLREAQLARAHDPSRAVAILDELSARYPQGVLAEERNAARILALCAAGRVDEARAEAKRFATETPSSVQTDRVRASCAFVGEKTPRDETDRTPRSH